MGSEVKIIYDFIRLCSSLVCVGGFAKLADRHRFLLDVVLSEETRLASDNLLNRGGNHQIVNVVIRVSGLPIFRRHHLQQRHKSTTCWSATCWSHNNSQTNTAENLNKEALTFAIPALWAPCDSIYAMYLLKSLNSSFVGWKVMIPVTGLWELWETESEAILPSGLNEGEYFLATKT